MPSLWFCVPVHGRLPLAAICLRQLRRTCNALKAEGIQAHAVIVADEQNLRALRLHVGPSLLGFAHVPQANEPVSRKFNDGFALALDERLNPQPADYVVPFGSDDWADHRIFLDLPDERTVVGFQHISFVREDGQEITSRFLNYEGGCGIRIYPRAVMAAAGFRPADPDRNRACDTSTLTNLRLIHGDKLRVEHRVIDPRQIVDWKTDGQQITPYGAVNARHRAQTTGDPFEVLAGLYPAQALGEMRTHYQRNLLVAA